jgi:hypothetical protein
MSILSAWWSATATMTVTVSNLLTVREDDRSMGWTERRWPVGDLGRRGRLERAVDGKEWSRG